MPLFKPKDAVNYVAKCEWCGDETGPLSNNFLNALKKVMIINEWTVCKDKQCYCCEQCLDMYEIEHIEDLL